MIQHPAILALITASLVTGCMLGYASWFGTKILETWDAESGSEQQLELERRTYLISAILTYSLVFQILSLFLYIFTAENLHSQFAGAMCAAGSLAVNSYGYPVLILKITNCLLAGVWLIINHVDTKGYDYPLIKPKYRLLGIVAPLVMLDMIFQFVYFFNLKADVITSCCGSLFSSDNRSIAGELASLPAEPMQWIFFISMAVTGISGIYFIITRKGSMLFSFVSAASFFISSLAFITFICLYFYELPTHHCPFCILQKEYGYIGYMLYLFLLSGGICGIGAGAIAPFIKIKSVANTIPKIQQKLAIITVASFTLFTAVTVVRMLTTPFRLG